MIAYIKGKIIAKTETYVVLENNGIGYKVFTTQKVLQLPVNVELALRIHTHVREDALQLFGFESAKDLAIFEMLNTVSGIGPKMALAILSAQNLELVEQAIATGDAALFTKIGGVGRKTADKIILELRDKIKGYSRFDGAVSEGSGDIINALENLGYSGREITNVIGRIDQTLNTEEKLKQALKLLGS